jgi:hypothetical protein
VWASPTALASNIGHVLGTGLLDDAESALVAARSGPRNLEGRAADCGGELRVERRAAPGCGGACRFQRPRDRAQRASIVPEPR